MSAVIEKKVNRKISASLAAVIDKLLKKNRDERYKSMIQVVEDLESCLNGTKTSLNTKNNAFSAIKSWF